MYGFLPVGSIERIGESQRGYQHVVMDDYNESISRYNDNLKVEFRDSMGADNRPPDKSPSRNANQLSLNVVHGTGLNFAPECNNFCFTRKTVCDHIKNNVPINNLGDYFVLPSKCFHHGCINSNSDI